MFYLFIFDHEPAVVLGGAKKKQSGETLSFFFRVILLS